MFVSRNSAKGHPAVGGAIAKARISPRQVQRDFNKPEGSGLASYGQSQNAKLVQRYLGHSDVATTLRYYVDVCPANGGVFPEDLEESAEMSAER